MKKLLFILFSLFSVFAMADENDVILTKSRQQVKCFVIEENETEVKYMLAEGEDASTYTMKKSDILKVYKADTQASGSQADVVVEKQQPVVEQPQETVVKAETPKNTTTKAVPQEIMDGDPNTLYRFGSDYYLGGRVISKKEKVEFYKNNCPDAYIKYKNGKSMVTGGAIVACLGLGVAAGGIAPAAMGNGTIAYALLGAGGGLSLLVGCPIMLAGGVKKESAYEVYATCCQKKPTAELRFGAGSDGIGLAIAF